jgi:hypothetical protein
MVPARLLMGVSRAEAAHETILRVGFPSPYEIARIRSSDVAINPVDFSGLFPSQEPLQMLFWERDAQLL